ncbi:unnamed protein product, partial [Coregonus sp. 'balchen']
MYLSKDQTNKTNVTCIRNRKDVIYNFKVSFFAMGQLPNFPWNPCGEAVSLSESTAVISEGTTGLVTWEAALYLAEWALENTHIFTGRTVLELGSGVGFTGIAVCRSCSPSRYVFSDCHLSVLHRLRDNVQLNGLDNQNSPRVSVSVEDLDWDAVTEKQLREIGATTVIAA